MKEIEKHKEKLPEGWHPHYDLLIDKDAKANVAMASVHYVASHLTNNPISQDKLAEKYDTTAASISKYYRIIMDNYGRNGLSTPQGDFSWSNIDFDYGRQEDTTTQEDILENFKDAYGLKSDHNYSLSQKDMQEITDSNSSTEVIDTLQSIGFEKDEEYNVYIRLTRKGMEKMLEENLFMD